MSVDDDFIDRILEGVGRRSRQMEDQDSLNAYFASDAMVAFSVITGLRITS